MAPHPFLTSLAARGSCALVLASFASAGSVRALGRPQVVEACAHPTWEATAEWVDDARFTEALAEIEHALSIGADDGRAQWLQLRSRALRLAGRASEALALEDALHAASAARAGRDPLRTASACFDLGALHVVRGDIDAAEVALGEALAACTRAGRAAEVQRAEVLVYLMECARARGDRERATELVLEAAEIQDRVLDPLDPRSAFRRTREAYFAYQDGDRQRARDLGLDALAAFRARLRPGHPRIAVALHNLGTYHQSLRELAAAARAFEEALALRKAEGSRLVGQTLVLLSQVREELGDLEDARHGYAEAITAIEESSGPEAVALFVPLRSLARLALRGGAHDEAEACARRALAILERDPRAGVEEQVELEALLGHVAWRSGRPEAAVSAWSAALDALERDEALDSPAAVDVLVQLGIAATALGLDTEAEHGVAYLERALVIQRRLLGEEHADVAWTLGYLAEAARAAGQDERAFATALEASAIVRRQLDASTTELHERDALGYASAYTPGLALVVAMAAVDPSTRAVAAWEAVIAARAAVFEAVRRQRTSASRGWVEGEADLAPARVPRFANLVRARPQGAALLAYVRCSRPDGYVAFVLPAGSDSPRVVDLGSAAEIDELVGPVRALARSAGSESVWRANAERLRARIWDPIATHLASASEIHVVPDGALLFFDLAGLPVGDGQYLLDSAAPILVLGSERDLVAASARIPDERPWDVLAVGGPEYGPAVASLSEAAGPAGTRAPRSAFPPLPESGGEARAVAAAWRSRGATARTLVGMQACELALRTALPGPRVLHLATHGFAEEAPAAGMGARGLALADAGPTWDHGPVRLGISRRHLGRSGLAFSGANSGDARDPRRDGLLLDEEVLELDLSGVDLAVLSACDSGSGEVQSGEGIFGLRRAFHLAGARAVVASLWPVADETARALMTDFHTRLAAGGTTIARALHEAKRAELARRRAARLDTHPWHWAGFVVAGEPVRIR